LSHPSHAAISPNCAKLAVKATSGRIVVIDPRSGEVLYGHKNQKEGEGSGVRFSPDGDQLVDGSWDGALTIRSACDGTILNRELFPGDMITRVMHDRRRETWLIEHSPKVRPGQQSPAPDYLSLRRWPFAPNVAHTLSFDWHIESATLSPDGSRVCFIQKWDQRRLHIARSDDGQILASSAAIEAGGCGSHLAWSGDGRLIASSSEGAFVFYRTTDLAVIGRAPCQYPSSIAFIPSGDEVALGSWDTTALTKLSDVLAGRSLA
jgi:WD40 repeat protein